MKTKGSLTTDQRRQYVMFWRDEGLSFGKIAQKAIEEFGAENLPKGYNKRLCYLDMFRELNKKSAAKLKVDTRRKLILDYTMAGFTCRQIATKLKDELGEQELPKNYSERDALHDLKRHLKKIERENKEELIISKCINRTRLQQLLNAMWEKAIQGDIQAIEQSRKIIRELSDLDSSYKVIPATVSASNGAPYTLAEIAMQAAKLESEGDANGNKN